jgi:hypothetical protein
MRGAGALPGTGGRCGIKCKGSERKGVDPFYVSSQLVSGRLTCLIVVPALVIARVTPLPE